MNGRVAHLDTSAFLKLVVSEPESAAVRRFLARWAERTSCALLRTEAIRALRRAGYDGRVAGARRLIQAMRIIRLDEPLLDRAATLEPRHLRSVDAVHLAAALTLGSDLGVLITYDDRLSAAAREQGMRVERPERS